MVFLSTLVFSAVGGACSVAFTHVHVYTCLVTCVDSGQCCTHV